MSWIKDLLLPSGLIMLLLLLSSVLLFLPRWRRIAYLAIASATSFYLVFSSGWTSSLLLSPLEYRYESLQQPGNYPDVENIVVLTAYVADDPLMPLSSRFNSNSLFRIVEAHNIYKACERCRIIVSGTARYVELMHEQLLALGIPGTDLLTDPIDGHTVDSAESLARKLESKQFFLVTSAGHMVRSMGVFRKQGFRPVPAPTDYLMPKDFTRASIMPTAQHLMFTDLAVNEYLGILWYRMTGKIESL